MQPCILFVTARSFCPVVVGNWIGFRREADRILRRGSFAAWIIDRPPALIQFLSHTTTPTGWALLLSTRAFMVGFGTTKLTRVWEPALLWNQ